MQLFFGAFCICFGEKVLSLEQKNFLCFKKRWKQRCFRSLQLNNHFQLTRNRLSLGEFSELSKIGRPFFLNSLNPVLYGWIFLYLGFTQWMTETYYTSGFRLPMSGLINDKVRSWYCDRMATKFALIKCVNEFTRDYNRGLLK